MNFRTFYVLFLASICGHALADEGLVGSYNGKDLTGWTTAGNWILQDEGVMALVPRDDEEGWKRYDAYLWADQTRLKDRPSSGWLGLQDHGQKFWVRNLRVREL